MRKSSLDTERFDVSQQLIFPYYSVIIKKKMEIELVYFKLLFA